MKSEIKLHDGRYRVAYFPADYNKPVCLECDYFTPCSETGECPCVDPEVQHCEPGLIPVFRKVR